MDEKRFIAKPLRELARTTGIHDKGYVVFLLQNETDDTGRRICNDSRISLILHRHPELADCVVKYAHDYYGERILRVIGGKA